MPYNAQALRSNDKLAAISFYGGLNLMRWRLCLIMMNSTEER